jgi:1-acyl-sn-glycerol-3-phosphate acyltransferase
MKGNKRHRFVFKVLMPIVRRFIAPKFNFKGEAVNVDQSPYIVLSNHVTNWDPVLINISFKEQMYFVASDQIYRMGFKSKLIKFLQSPIPIAKTTQEIQTIIDILNCLRKKCNVCIFPEGNTTSDGETLEIQPSISKLIKKAKVTLITYRFTGGFFTKSKWARFTHKGKMEGRLVQIYSPEKIASMSEDEIHEVIKKDLYVNAYAEQEKERIAYQGQNPAEYLETILYCCPKCKEFSALKSDNDLFFCTCGYKVRYNDYGYFESLNDEPPVFTTILDWARWQRKELNTIADNIDNLDSNTPIITDDEQTLIEVAKASHNTFIAKGKLCLYKDRLSVTSQDQCVEFPIKSIVNLTVFARMRIIFSANNKLYEIHSEYQRSAIKYADAFKALKDKQ